MKKLLLFAAMALMGMTACQQAEETSGAASGEVDVMVTTTLPAEMGLTRAAGDGTSIHRCIMEIYLDGTLYGSRKVASVAKVRKASAEIDGEQVEISEEDGEEE